MTFPNADGNISPTSKDFELPNSRDSLATLQNNHATHYHSSIYYHQQPPPHPFSNHNVSPSLSATSSISVSNASSKYTGRPYTGKLPISAIPELVELCSQFLKSRNVTGLAMLARQSGLPPHLRYKIWPVLLKYHPFVQNPYIEIDINEDEDAEGDDDNDNDTQINNNNNNNDNYKIPIKEIKFELRKYLKSSERYVPKVLSNEIKDLYEIQTKIFDVIEHAIIRFLKKWGSIVNYNSGLTWIALGLAEWMPPLVNSQFVLCGRDDVAKNGTKLRNINDSYFERFNNSNLTSESSSIFDSQFSSVSPDSVTPLASLTNSPNNDGFKEMTFAELYERMVLVILHSPDPSTIENFNKEKENEELKNGETKDESKISISKELKQLSSLPFTGGLIMDRISFFLFGMRKLLPELHNHLTEEDCLNGDWMIWWLKFSGSKVWSRYDRGRIWDLLLGYRTNYKNFESDMKELYELSPEQIGLLGQDLFWNPMDNVEDDDEDEKRNKNELAIDEEDGGLDNDDIIDEHIDKHDRSLSILTLMSKRSPSISIEKTPTLGTTLLNSPKTPLILCDSELNTDAGVGNNINHNNHNIIGYGDRLPPLEDIEPILELPFSKVHPHVEIIFISLAFLKSKEYTISELDQSEIKTLFNRLTSLRTDSGEISSFVSTRECNKLQSNETTENLNNNNSNNNNTTTDNDNMDMVLTTRKSNRDIENILIEAGELWRRFLYINMVEENDLEKL